VWNLEIVGIVTLTWGFKVWNSMKGDVAGAMSSFSSLEEG
jgi:hypothetical protein